MKIMKNEQAISLGFSEDKKKRRRQHRIAAKKLLKQGGFFNNYSAIGSSFYDVAQWHLFQARFL
jgi:hypothetical protein